MEKRRWRAPPENNKALVLEQLGGNAREKDEKKKFERWIRASGTMLLMKTTMVALLFLAYNLFAQAPRPAAVVATPKNLKILTADDTLMDAMRGFNEALGVECVYCHVQGDFASDANPRK